MQTDGGGEARCHEAPGEGEAMQMASGYGDLRRSDPAGTRPHAAVAATGRRLRWARGVPARRDLRHIHLSAAGIHDIRDTLQVLAEMAVEILGADLGVVLTFHAESHLLLSRAAMAAGGPVEASIHLTGDGVAARAVATGAPVCVPDGVDAPRVLSGTGRAWGTPRAGVAVPIHDGARVAGVIVIYHSEPRPDTAVDVQVLAALAAHAESALQACALHEHQRQIAETIQRSLRPRLPASVPGVDVGHAYLPCKEAVGGDYYDIFPLPDGRIGIVVGDVCGNGIPAAIHTAMGKYMLRAFAMETENPGAVLRKLNEAICAQTQSEIFVTVFYGILHAGDPLVYANGGHPYPILRRANGSLVTLETTGTVVGMLPRQEEWERDVRVESGDVLLLYTDGITEARQGVDMFAVERLMAVVADWPGGHPQDLVDLVVRRVGDFTGGGATDDIALLALRVR